MAKVYNFVGKFGSAGSGDGQFGSGSVRGIDVDANYIYVADSNNSRIQIFNKTTFAFVAKFGTFGSGDGQLKNPYDVAVDANYIYVADPTNSRLQVFNKTSPYAYVSKVSISGVHAVILDKANANYLYVGYNDGNNQLVIAHIERASPHLIDNSLNTEQSIGDWATLNNSIDKIYSKINVATTAIRIYTKNPITFSANLTDGAGCREAQVDDNYLYIVNSTNNVVRVYDINTHALIESFGSIGSGDGQFDGPVNIAVYNDILYVNDQGNNRIQVFNFTYQTAPAAPSGLTAACGTNRTIVLNWTDNS